MSRGQGTVATRAVRNPGVSAGLTVAIPAALNREQRMFSLASALQTTLEPEKLIDLFSRDVQDVLPHDGMVYENAKQELSVEVGQLEKHSVSYPLLAADEPLGQLKVSRRRKFTSAELRAFGQLLSCLVYPLRNALLYRAAVTAALRDPLTGASNRTAMNAALIRETELSRRHGTPLSLIALDLDHFKDINDRYGHLAGDQVLRSVATAVADCTRSTDVLFRYGGEEFLILLSNTAKQGALMLAERIRRAIASHVCRHGDQSIEVTTSLGVACYAAGDRGDSLFERADTALYAAKAAGRNCVKFVG